MHVICTSTKTTFTLILAEVIVSSSEMHDIDENRKQYGLMTRLSIALLSQQRRVEC